MRLAQATHAIVDECDALEEITLLLEAIVAKFETVTFHEDSRSFEKEEKMAGRGRKAVAKVEMTSDLSTTIAQWKKASDELAVIKSTEAQLRMKLVAENFDVAKLEGSQTIDIGWGWRMKSTKNLNYTATNESHQTEQLLAAVGAIDPGLAQGLVRWKPELSTTVYRQVLALLEEHPELKVAFAAAITVKPGMPVLELIPPKAETPAIETTIAPPQTQQTPNAGTVFTDDSGIEW